MNLRGLTASWFAPLLIHHQNQSEAMLRASAAKAHGLDPTSFGTPFPGGTVSNTTTNNTKAGGWGWLFGPILGAGLLAAGGSAALTMAKPTPTPAAPMVSSSPTTTPTTSATSSPASPQAERHWDAITEELQPDGTWKQIRREHLQ